MDYNTVYDVDLKGKTVFLRVDLNSSVVEGRPVVSSRMREHSKTIYTLSEAGAKVVVLSHQGRKGDPDFIPLKRHSDFIKKFTDKNVKFVSWEEDYVKAIKGMKGGDVIVLDNTRFLDIEEAKVKDIKEFATAEPLNKLIPLGNYFVQDALSICHRKHATVVGFAVKLPVLVGPCLDRELKALEKLEEIKDSKLLVLGGAKPEDSVAILKSMLEKGMVEKVCVGGLFGELFLKADGLLFGAKDKFFSEKGYDKLLPEMKSILGKYSEKIILPVDFGCDRDGKREEIAIGRLPIQETPKDIGRETTELFKKHVRESKLVVFNGPMGVYEEKQFSIGTKKLLETIAFWKCYSILGGGDTERALSMLGLLPQDFSHVSLAGKALLSYLAGEKLPGLEIIK